MFDFLCVTIGLFLRNLKYVFVCVCGNVYNVYTWKTRKAKEKMHLKTEGIAIFVHLASAIKTWYKIILHIM